MALPEELPPTHPRLARTIEIVIGALLLGFFLAFERFLAGSWRLVAAACAAVGFYFLVGGGAQWLLQRTVGPRRWVPLVLVPAAMLSGAIFAGVGRTASPVRAAMFGGLVGAWFAFSAHRATRRTPAPADAPAR